MTPPRPSNPRELLQSPESPVAIQHLCPDSLWFLGPKMAPCRSNRCAGPRSRVVLRGKPLGAEHARWRRGAAGGAARGRDVGELCWHPVGPACSLCWEAEGSRQRSRKGAAGTSQVGQSPTMGPSPYGSGEARRPRCLLTGSSGLESSGSSRRAPRASQPSLSSLSLLFVVRLPIVCLVVSQASLLVYFVLFPEAVSQGSVRRHIRPLRAL